MLDLHSHLLPGVDDGSRSVDRSVAVLTRFAAAGISGVCLTPHLRASQAGAGVPAAHDRAFEALAGAAPPVMRLYRGVELMLDVPLEAGAALRRLTLNGSRYLLVEFPRLVTAPTVEWALDGVRALGLVPVVAHPERYAACTVERARRWKEQGALLQVDGPTLLSPRSRGERARALVSQGLADLLAADNHGDDRSLAPLRDACRARRNETAGDLLLRGNPEAIVADGEVQPVPPFEWGYSLADRVEAFFRRRGEERP